MRFVFALGTFSVFAGSPVAILAQTWTVPSKPILSIGEVEGAPEYQFNRIADVLKLADGRVVVANGGSNELRFYDSSGRYVRALGRKGQGPGEFASLSGMHLVGRDSLYVFDQTLRRVSIFDTRGTLLTSFQLQNTPDQVRPIRMYRLAGVLPNRDLVMVAYAFPADMKPKPTLHFDSLPTLLYRANGTLRGEVGEPAGMDMYAEPRQAGDVKFGRVSSGFVHRDLLYMTDGGKLEIRVYDPRRGLIRSISSNRPVRPVTAADVQLLFDYYVGRVPAEKKAEIRGYFESWPRAQNKPWISALIVDDRGFLWAERYEPYWSKVARTWEVFDTAGRNVASITFPAGLRVHQIGADFVLGVWKDDFDVEHVRIYSLRRA
jgi:hypothetical protein